MIITFKELGIKASSYNGYSYAAAHALIVNIACDYIMRYHFYGMIEEDCIDPIHSFTNFLLHTVDVKTIQCTVH